MPRRPIPRPLDQLPAGELAGVCGVLTDIDDTLTRDGAIEPAALAALHALHAAGLPVLAITGRPAGWSEPFVRSWPVAAIVAENGGVLLQRRAPHPPPSLEPVRHNGTPSAPLTALSHGATAGALQRHFTVDDGERAARFIRLQACAAAVLAEVPGSTLARDSASRLTDIAIDHSEFSHLAPSHINAVVAVMRAHGLTATVSSIHINGWLGDHDKWTGALWAVRQVLQRPLDVAQWVYVGDSSNDQALFARVPLSVGVANIARFLPVMDAPPAWVTRGERGVGFAELAARLLAERQARG